MRAKKSLLALLAASAACLASSSCWQRGRQLAATALQIALQAVFTQGHGDHGLHIDRFERLDKVAERLSRLGALQCGLIGMRSQINDRQIVTATNDGGSLDTIHITGNAYIHENNIRGMLFNSFKSLGSSARCPGHNKPATG